MMRIDPLVFAGDVHEPETTEVVASFALLYQSEWAGLVRLARNLLEDDHRAEEVVQDACERTLMRWGRVDDPGAYLRSCVVNGCRSEMRRRVVRRRIDPTLRRADRTDDVAIEAASDSELLRALATLGTNKRIALTLRFWLDMSEADIALTMGVRPGTVKSLVSRGLADLRKVVTR
jgi:RNA polymerase sigma factor (sigma-70 family)